MVRVSRRGRGWFGVAAVTVVGLVVGATWVVTSADDHAEILDGAAPSPGWVRLEYRQVQVRIPDDWGRQPDDDCVHAVDHWGPRTTAACGSRPGVSFVDDSGTFDAAGEPAVVYSSLDAEGPAWLGYVRLDDLVVSVSDDDRTVVQRVIDSIPVEGFQPVE